MIKQLLIYFLKGRFIISVMERICLTQYSVKVKGRRENGGRLTWTRVVFHIETDVSALDMSRLERNRAKQRELSAGTVLANLSH